MSTYVVLVCPAYVILEYWLLSPSIPPVTVPRSVHDLYEGEVQPRAHSSTVTVAYGGHPEECAGTVVAVLRSCINLPSLTVSSEAPTLLYLAHHPL